MAASAGAAPRSRSSIGPPVMSRPSTAFMASRPIACATPRAISADSTIRAAFGSACRASRRLVRRRDGSRVIMARKFSSRKASRCWFHPVS
ncbi:hypothetical protein QF030_002507 [Streptomyces rishiriensis]|uniref:Uncharacterized protein n=1 Tax=Streptomyces rishiriensis TaxID=68264 RepID=A0ABU0NML1_STRRH|nr:hypothetical protein [Streptomyces rishiriensis]